LRTAHVPSSFGEVEAHGTLLNGLQLAIRTAALESNLASVAQDLQALTNFGFDVVVLRKRTA